MSRHWAQRVLRLLASTYAVAGRLAKARFMHLASVGKRSWVAAAVGLMAAIIVLPIPFGNLLPALATVFIAIGLVFRDGVAIIIGLTTACLALVATVALVALAWIWGSEWITRLLLP